MNTVGGTAQIPRDRERLSVSNREGDDPVMLRRGLISDLLQTYIAVI